MEYEKIDEATRREACEKVKQIVKAIKAIKMKYYLNFSKISEVDQQTYQKLEANLEKVSIANNLDNLKVALMEEVSAKYDRDEKDINQEEKKQPEDNNLLKCYGVIDVQKKALEEGKLKKAFKCQEILKQYMKDLDSVSFRELVVTYKREKFGELVQSRLQVEEKNNIWNEKMKYFCKPEDVKERESVAKQVKEVEKNNIPIKEGTEQEVSIG